MDAYEEADLDLYLFRDDNETANLNQAKSFLDLGVAQVLRV